MYFPCKFSFSSYVWFHFQNISLPCPNLCPGIHVLQIPTLCHCFSKPCVSNSTRSLLWETPVHPSLIGKVTLLRVPLIIFGNTGPKAKYLLLSKLCLWPKTSLCLPQQWKHLQSNHWEVFLVPAGAWGPRVLAQRGAAQHAAPLAPWSTLLHKLRAWSRQRWGGLQQMRQIKEGVAHNPSCFCKSVFPPLPEIPVAWGPFKAVIFLAG